MPEFYAIIVICGLLGPCGQAREQYLNLQSCESDKQQLAMVYGAGKNKTVYVTCHEGDIIVDEPILPSWSL